MKNQYLPVNGTHQTRDEAVTIKFVDVYSSLTFRGTVLVNRVLAYRLTVRL